MTLERKIQLIELGEDQLGMGRNQLTARSIEGRGGRISRLGFGGEEGVVGAEAIAGRVEGIVIWRVGKGGEGRCEVD